MKTLSEIRQEIEVVKTIRGDGNVLIKATHTSGEYKSAVININRADQYVEVMISSLLLKIANQTFGRLDI